jgi:hypothetical protein
MNEMTNGQEAIMFYSSERHVRTRQIAGDSIVVLWCILWLWLGRLVHNLVDDLAVAGQELAGSGQSISGAGSGLGSFTKAVGSPFASLGHSLSNAGNSQVHAVHHVAFALGLLVALGPSLPILIRRIFMRLLWVKLTRLLTNRSTGMAAQRILAERALIHQPIDRLLHISSDPVADVAAGNLMPYATLERDASPIHLR